MLVQRVGYSVDPLGKFGRIGSAATAPWCVDHQQPKPGLLRPRPDQENRGGTGSSRIHGDLPECLEPRHHVSPQPFCTGRAQPGQSRHRPRPDLYVQQGSAQAGDEGHPLV